MSSSSHREQKSISLTSAGSTESTTPFQLDVDAARLSDILREFCDDKTASHDANFVCSNTTDTTLALVVQFLEHKLQARRSGQGKHEKEEWLKAFLNRDLNEVVQLLQAADYLKIQPLMDACVERLAADLRHRPEHQLREIFGVVDDFTPEERAEFRKKHAWAFV